MNAQRPLKLWSIALLLAFLGGLAQGSLVAGTARLAPEERSTQRSAPRERDSSLDLQVLGANAHWGEYLAATPNSSRSLPATAPGDAGTGRFRLIGIEWRSGQRLALLAPGAALANDAASLALASSPDGLWRVRIGDKLLNDTEVSTIGSDSVTLSTNGTNTTLNLYEHKN